MTIRTTITLFAIVVMLTGCDQAGPVPTSKETAAQMETTLAKTIRGDAGMAAFRAPRNCEKFPGATTRSGDKMRVRTGCVINVDDTMIILGLSEMTIPFEDAFTVLSGGGGGFRQTAAAFPREMLSDYITRQERSALAAGEPGWRYSNQRSKLLPGNGGVAGASACVRFSFNGRSTGTPSRRSIVSGLRCARFGAAAKTVEEVMLEVMSFYPVNRSAPDEYDAIATQAGQSLGYR